MKIQSYKLRRTLKELFNTICGRSLIKNRKNSKHHWSLLKITFACVVLLVVLSIVFIQTYTTLVEREFPISVENPQDNRRRLRGYLVRTEGCRISHMGVSYPTALKCHSNETIPDCNRGIPALYGYNRTSIFLIHSSLAAYRIQNTSGMACCYTPFWRDSPRDFEPDDVVSFGSRCIPVGESARIRDEFIQLTCRYDYLQIYMDFFSFVPLKQYSQPAASDMPSRAPLNVLVVGLDGVSRVNLHRQMPNTVEYLHDISAVELLGYNKIADNRIPNLFPVLTGLYEENILGFCYSDYRRFDGCPLVWNVYKRRGFVTAFGEDASQFGIFDYQRTGFKRQPTDYVWNVFHGEAEMRIGNQRTATTQAAPCLRSRFVYMEFLNYIDHFVETMYKASRQYFAFYWSSTLTQDSFDRPRLGDDHYKAFFQKMHDSGRLENTALFFVSGHGARCDDAKPAYQAHMEERLPFVFVVLPSWFKRKYTVSYANLKRNVRRLTTPFDLHETLVHLAYFGGSSHEWPADQKKRGCSLFTRISSNRTCESAGIPDDWCACQTKLLY